MTPRLLQISITRTARRTFGHTSTLGRDVMAKYRSPLPPPIPNGRRRGVFVTSSTSPAGSSFQEVPPPGSAMGIDGVRKAVPLPAMASIDDGPESKPVVKAEDQEMVVQGVIIPAKPKPPHEEECCMSGCVHCVYNMYSDDLELYTDALEAVHKALLEAGVPNTKWPAAVRKLDDKGGNEIKQEEKAKAESGIDPVMAGFLAMEKRLKEKQLSKKGSTA